MFVGHRKTIHDDGYLILLESLKAERLKAGLTQTDLGAKLGADQSHISKYERAERRLDVMELRTICKALDLDFVQFLERFEKTLKKKGYD